jgi:GNAT superfamily N-acetyltransferase
VHRGEDRPPRDALSTGDDAPPGSGIRSGLADPRAAQDRVPFAAMDPASLALLTEGQEARAAEVLAQAFQDDPLYVHFVPDPATRSAWLPHLWRGVVRYARRYGEVHGTPDLSGLACWLAPGNAEVTLWRVARTGFALPRAFLRLSAQARRRAAPVARHVEHARRQAMTGPFWYLWAMGVAPGRQGQGIGGALLRPILDRADRAALPCYLETETARNVAFYERHGFRVVRDAIAGQGVRLWTMTRAPRPGAGA